MREETPEQDDGARWDRMAGRYDRLVRLFDGSYPRARTRLADDLSRGGQVLELAAGTGQFTFDLARLAETLVATDVSPEMVDRLAQRITDAGSSNISARIMSADDIDSDDGTFDAVVCANALHVMARPGDALREVRRVLRPDGVLIAPTFLHGVGPMRRALSRAMSLVSPFVARNRFDLEGLAAAIREAGFDIMHAESMPGLFPLGYVAARRR